MRIGLSKTGETGSVHEILHRGISWVTVYCKDTDTKILITNGYVERL